METIFSQTTKLNISTKTSKAFKMHIEPKAAKSTIFKNKEIYKDFTQFSNNDWYSDFAVIISLFRYINELNTKIMGKGTFVMKCTL